MELRQLLEGAALAKMLAEPDQEKLAVLAKAVAHQREALVIQDTHAYQEWHVQFHGNIIDVLNNPLVSMIYSQVMILMRAAMEKTGSQPEVSARAIEDHANMVAALRNGASVELNQILTTHLTNFIVDVTQHLD